MGLFDFSTSGLADVELGMIEEKKRSLARGREQRILGQAREKQLKQRKEEFRLSQLKGQQLGRGVAQFGRVGLQQPDFSPEQNALKSMFGGGERMWGRADSQPVTMYNDLNPRQRGDNSTAELFGFG